eukprot:m.2304 g.2304  ORF g.2304 m.2304 type:complete len:199 (+) comp8566_c0_seq1:117-713(+)
MSAAQPAYQLEKGDHIYVYSWVYAKQRHAIVIGRDEVVAFNLREDMKPTNITLRCSLESFLGFKVRFARIYRYGVEEVTYKISRSGTRTREQCRNSNERATEIALWFAEKADEKFGAYKFIEDNSEAIAKFCKRSALTNEELNKMSTRDLLKAIAAEEEEEPKIPKGVQAVAGFVLSPAHVVFDFVTWGFKNFFGRKK